ncbi:MAG: O-antigen ligase family protein, partial [Thermomicrobia bacterium]|nr:O-antigen ligase family protein [Thermomicrobia bacterium]
MRFRLMQVSAPMHRPQPSSWIEEVRGHRFASPALIALLTLIALVLLKALGPLAAVALVIGVGVVLLTLAEPRYGLYLAVLSVPVQQYGSLKGLTATQGAFALVIVAWAAGKLLRGAQWDVLRDANLWRFALFYVAILASGRVAGDIKATLVEGFHWGEALAIYVIARDTVRARRHWAGLVACFFIAASGEAFIGTVQSKLGLGNLSFFVGGIARSFGTFGRPNSYAGYLEMVFPLALTVALWALFALPAAVRRWQAARGRSLIEERRTLLPLLGVLVALAGAGATALMLVAGITLSLSRGAWLGSAVAVLVMMLLAGRRWAIAVLVATGLLLGTLALGGAGVLPKTIQQRIGSVGSSLILLEYYKVPITPENFAVKERMAYWFGGIRMAEDYPWQGVGLGNYGAQYDAKYFTSPFMKSQVHAHNYYIHITAETGVIGLTAYLLLIGGVLATGIGAVRRTARDPFARALALGAVGIVVAVA